MSQIMSHLPVLVILLPLCGTLLCPLISHFSADWGKRTVICTLFLAVICSLVQLWQVISGKEALHYELGGWLLILLSKKIIAGLFQRREDYYDDGGENNAQ